MSIVLLFSWNSYTSPVREAGREFERNVRSYRNSEVHSLEDVTERMDLLDNHFNSATFSKMQGGDRTEITLEHVQTLFGESDRMFDDIEMFPADMAYQYDYGNQTLNFHTSIFSVREYVYETYSEVHYDPANLDELFFNALNTHQTQYSSADDSFEIIAKENIDPLINAKTPTRIIRRGNWALDAPSYQYYFDVGGAEYSPEEYFLLHFRKGDNNPDELSYMERRFNQPYLENDSEAKAEQKSNSWYELKEFYENLDEETEESQESQELQTVADISEKFGDIARMSYNFNEGLFRVYWLSVTEDISREFIAEVPISDEDLPLSIAEISQLEVTDFRRDYLSEWDRTVMTADFIGK